MFSISLPALKTGVILAFTVFGAASFLSGNILKQVVHGQDAKLAPPASRPLGSLKTVKVREAEELGDFIKDREAVIALGKSFFWDMQAGGDGIQACASCHYQAGADPRSKNQLNPRVGSDFEFGGVNYQLEESDFPFHKLTDAADRDSPLAKADVNDVSGSQGVFKMQFVDIGDHKNPVDKTLLLDDAIFSVGGLNVRQTTGRNTPPVINAVFNYRNFWDGRAQNDFNGVNPFGSRDPNAFVIKADKPNSLTKVKISLKHSSLASQAVGPVNNSTEMSSNGRVFPNLGKKMLRLVPFRVREPEQFVSPNDSVLGVYSNYPKAGLKPSAKYKSLIKAAFQPQWWRSGKLIAIDPQTGMALPEQTAGIDPDADDEPTLPDDKYTLMQYNFSLFWGLAIQMYESTLRSDDSPFDRYMEGDNKALSDEQKLGLKLFNGKANCAVCHTGPEFTSASVDNVSGEKLERMQMGDETAAVYDNGFYNIGVRPTSDDKGLGELDPLGNPLSMSQMAQNSLERNPSRVIKVNPQPGVDQDPLFKLYERVAVDGSFKVPSLRNIEMTAPYFHNGGQATLLQVVEFYNRGGDFSNTDKDADIKKLYLTEREKMALVAFLKSLTDKRVLYNRPPFDHPSLTVPNGQFSPVITDGTGRAKQEWLNIPMVGKSGLSTPLPNFLNLR